jgi:hypothetical protein
MLVLAVAAFRRYVTPAVGLHHRDEIPNLHGRRFYWNSAEIISKTRASSASASCRVGMSA